MSQVNDFEKMLVTDGIYIFKFWLDITKEEQEKRFYQRRTDPLKQWKIGPVDAKAQELWNEYTKYRDLMFNRPNRSIAHGYLLTPTIRRRLVLNA
jgi:polyphosphate kinase 2 (PPK2 family)